MEGGEKMTSGVYERKPKNDEEENILHTAIEFLEKKKGHEDIDVNIINGWQKEIKTLGEAIALGFSEAFEKKHKPIKKVLYLSIKDNKEEVEKIVESYNKWLEQIKTKFPKTKIAIGLYGNKNIMIRNELGRFEVVKDEEE